jgi:hypothetical protein
MVPFERMQEGVSETNEEVKRGSAENHGGLKRKKLRLPGSC